VKLSSLPLCEIGQCEWALGNAIEWWLWLGKTPLPSPVASTSAPNVIIRTVVRCHSDSDLMAVSKLMKRLQTEPHIIDLLSSTTLSMRGLARHATLPGSRLAEQIPSSMTMQYSQSLKPREPPLEALSTGYDMMMTTTPMCTTMMTGLLIYTPVNAEQFGSSSNNVATPTLTFSPLLMESSGGDCTIYMASFLDEPTSTFGTNGCFILTNKNFKVSPPIGKRISMYLWNTLCPNQPRDAPKQVLLSSTSKCNQPGLLLTTHN
jgi:PHO85 cyclin-5